MSDCTVNQFSIRTVPEPISTRRRNLHLLVPILKLRPCSTRTTGLWIHDYIEEPFAPPKALVPIDASHNSTSSRISRRPRAFSLPMRVSQRRNIRPIFWINYYKGELWLTTGICVNWKRIQDRRCYPAIDVNDSFSFSILRDSSKPHSCNWESRF